MNFTAVIKQRQQNCSFWGSLLLRFPCSPHNTAEQCSHCESLSQDTQSHHSLWLHLVSSSHLPHSVHQYCNCCHQPYIQHVKQKLCQYCTSSPVVADTSCLSVASIVQHIERKFCFTFTASYNSHLFSSLLFVVVVHAGCDKQDHWR